MKKNSIMMSLLFSMSVFSVYAQGNAPNIGGTGGMLMIVQVLAIGLIIYFLMIRPQSKQRKETKRMLDELAKGDKIQTIGGIIGKVLSVKDEHVIIQLRREAEMEIVKSSVANVLSQKKSKTGVSKSELSDESKDEHVKSKNEESVSTNE